MGVAFKFLIQDSRIPPLDGTRGKIQYRQYPIEQLYQQNDYEEVIHLLIWGHLPSFDEGHMLRKAFEEQARPHKSVIGAIGTFPRETPSFLMIIAGPSAWAASRPSNVPVFAGKVLYHNDPGALDEAIIGSIAAFTTVVALVYCHQNDLEFTPPDPQLSIVENMLLMIGFVNEYTSRPDPETIKSLNRLWILYADHEMTNSTAAFLHVTSSLADPISGLIAAVASGSGPLHGGAIDLAYMTFEKLGNKANVSKLIDDVKAKKLRLFGVGHRMYNTADPRACLLKDLMEETGNHKDSSPLLSVAMEIERIVSNDPYFTLRNLRVNADLYGCFVYSAL
ncbi:hypothetical protein HYFRA_00007064 [Hymenoscyphus fraxineus]|uniref:Citrate synthase n=1 Tax=Hymenoscyphus fraxineus TaxID=746836 RepID=A0A9N9KZN8_9HELO|nr:hypothetical protein HYFRA_00007064 [Hymenoscyphus fraxineus]